PVAECRHPASPRDHRDDRALRDRTRIVSADAPGVDGTEVVHLDVPAISGRLRLIRLAVVGLATEYGADVDDLEDVRIATGEICTHLVNQAAPDHRLKVEIHVTRPS